MFPQGCHVNVGMTAVHVILLDTCSNTVCVCPLICYLVTFAMKTFIICFTKLVPVSTEKSVLFRSFLKPQSFSFRWSGFPKNGRKGPPFPLTSSPCWTTFPRTFTPCLSSVPLSQLWTVRATLHGLILRVSIRPSTGRWVHICWTLILPDVLLSNFRGYSCCKKIVDVEVFVTRFFHMPSSSVHLRRLHGLDC